MGRHPTRDLLRELLTAELPDDRLDEILSHLERGCVRCLFAMRELMAEAEQDLFNHLLHFCDPALPRAERDAGYERALRQAFFRSVTFELETRLAPTLLAELDRRPPALRRETIRTAPRYQLFGLAEHLFEESRRAGFRDVARAQELAELAVEVADALDPKIYLPSVILDCQALCRAFLGNARRVASDLFGAERAFQDALLHLDCGAGSEVVRAEVLSLLGSLRTDQARYDEGRRALEEALSFFRRFGQREDEGKVRFQIAKTHAKSGEPAKAVEMLEQALPLIDEAGDDRLAAVARHALVGWLVDAGDPLEALARFEKAQDYYDRFQDESSFQLRRTWQEAYLYAALGDASRAEPLFEEVRQAATERELPYELAMVNLELAVLHLEEGNTARVRELAEEMVPIFRSRELHSHAMAAVYLFQHAAKSETATSGLAKEVLQYLRRAQNNPYLPFR